MITELQDFILKHNDWENLLKSAPYNIKIKREDGYILFKYDQLESDFSLNITKECRGLILREKDFKVVCFPFTKFFNVDEKYADKINWSNIKVYEKIDGSLIKVWYNNGWHISTNGTINAFHTEIIPSCNYDTYGYLALDAFKKQNLNFDKLNIDYTYMFELVSPYTRIVVPYDKIDIYHLGTRSNITGKEIDVDIGIKKPKTYQFKTEEEIKQAASLLPYDEEGYVVVDNDYHRVKIKSLEYLNVHRLVGNLGVNKKRIFELVRANDYDEFLSYFPEYKSQFDEIVKEYELFQSKLRIIEKEVLTRQSLKRKDFALWIIKTYPKLSDFGFKLYDKKVSNYKEYLDKLSSIQIFKNLERGDKNANT